MLGLQVSGSDFRAPYVRCPGLPTRVSKKIEKKMIKSAKQRYQSGKNPGTGVRSTIRLSFIVQLPGSLYHGASPMFPGFSGFRVFRVFYVG